MDILFGVFKETAKVTLFVMLMMIIIDFINVKSKGKLESILQTGNKWKQYFVASLLGTVPGCLGSFAGVLLYIQGMISFGALKGLMLATTLGVEFNPESDWNEREQEFKMSGKIVKTFNFTQSAEGDKSGIWTTVIATAILLP